MFFPNVKILERCRERLHDQFIARSEVFVEAPTVTPAAFITSATPIPSSPRSRNRLAATLTIRSCVVCLSLLECPISIPQLYYRRNPRFGYPEQRMRVNS